jgi:VanZ family protein
LAIGITFWFATPGQIWFLSAVRKALPFSKYWLPVLLWMLIIFSASADTESGQHSSRIIAPLLRWLFPHISSQAVEEVVLFARKCAHLTEYAILGVLVWRALRKPAKNDPRPWSWPTAWAAIAGGTAYAASDEFHQRFVPQREPTFRDVVIDVIGGMLGLMVVWALGAWRKRRARTGGPRRPQSTHSEIHKRQA